MRSLSEFDTDFVYACYAQDLASGNTFWFRTIRTATIKLYLLKAASCPMRNNPFSYSRYPSYPPLVKDILDEHSRWEEVPNRREPITLDMLSYFHKRAKTSHPDGYDAALFDWLLVGIFAGFRKTEWMQDSFLYKSTQTYQRVDKHSSSRAFIAADFTFSPFPPSQHHHLSKSSTTNGQLHIKWRFQKSSQNGQSISYNHNIQNEEYSVVLAAQRILDRAKCLHIPSSHPIAVFATDDSFSCFHYNLVEVSLRESASVVYNIKSIKTLQLFSSHSLRVGACVLLHSLQHDALFIQFRLRWRSLSFMSYLRNTPRIAALHNFTFNKGNTDDMCINTTHQI